MPQPVFGDKQILCTSTSTVHLSTKSVSKSSSSISHLISFPFPLSSRWLIHLFSLYLPSPHPHHDFKTSQLHWQSNWLGRWHTGMQRFLPLVMKPLQEPNMNINQKNNNNFTCIRYSQSQIQFLTASYARMPY